MAPHSHVPIVVPDRSLYESGVVGRVCPLAPAPVCLAAAVVVAVVYYDPHDIDDPCMGTAHRIAAYDTIAATAGVRGFTSPTDPCCL